MKPSLFPGDYIVGTSFFKSLLLKGRIVVLFDFTHSYIIKRVLKVNNKDYIKLKNDNINTTSLFCDKPIEKNRILFLVLFIIRKKYIDRFIKLNDKLKKFTNILANNKI